jgi:2,3-diaminopropionate biosynthesis protein SbnA
MRVRFPSDASLHAGWGSGARNARQMLFESAIACVGDTPLVRLTHLWGGRINVTAKLEMLNPGGSIKDRTAKYMIEQGFEEGTIDSSSHLVESSSGNFGVAVAIVAKHYGLRFTCVVDPKICDANLTFLRLLGTEVEVVSERDDTGGYLKTRLARVRELCASDPNAVSLNQYANDANWRAHYLGIANEIVRDLPEPPDYVVVAVSTSGTIVGIARRLTEMYPAIKVIAVDVWGSAVFGSPARERFLPGIGSSVVPEILDRSLIDEVVLVTDQEAVDAAHELLEGEGVLAGASSGAVVAAINQIASRLPSGCSVVTVFPDRGERYLETVYRWPRTPAACDGLVREGAVDRAARRPASATA